MSARPRSVSVGWYGKAAALVGLLLCSSCRVVENSSFAWSGSSQYAEVFFSANVTHQMASVWDSQCHRSDLNCLKAWFNGTVTFQGTHADQALFTYNLGTGTLSGLVEFANELTAHIDRHYPRECLLVYIENGIIDWFAIDAVGACVGIIDGPGFVNP